MEEKEFNLIKDKYDDFRKMFSANIINASISLNNEDCYLIEENWIDNLREGFNKYKNLKKANKLNKEFDYYNFLPEKDPNFINNFSTILKNLQNNKKIRCINQELIELIYDKSDFKNDHCIKYYSGNNKLIIEYEGDNKSILLLDPLNKKEIKNNIKIILIKDKKKLNLFKNILSENDYTKKYLNYILPIAQYLNKLKDILRLFIYFYYYNKELDIYNNNTEIKSLEGRYCSFKKRGKEKKAEKRNQENIFNKIDYYYLINPVWLNKFKDIFNYSEIYEILKLLDKKIKNINYINLNNYYDQIISEINENIVIRKKEFFGDIFSAEKIKLNSYKLYNILYHKNCYIINSQIMNIIKSIFNDNEMNIKSKNIFFSKNSIYEINEKKVIIGNLNGELLFIPKYIIVYDSIEIFESEKNSLLENAIENYIKEFKCDLNNPYSQILKNNKGNIGKFIVLQKGIHNTKEEFNNNQNLLNDTNYPNIYQINDLKINLNKKDSIKKKNYINNSKENNLEKDKEIIELKDINEKNNNLMEQNKILEKEIDEEKRRNKDYKLKENELINSNMKLQKQIIDLEKSINKFEEINNKLREQEKIINEYKNKYSKMEDELKAKDGKLKVYLNIQKELEQKENEIININKIISFGNTFYIFI